MTNESAFGGETLMTPPATGSGEEFDIRSPADESVPADEQEAVSPEPTVDEPSGDVQPILAADIAARARDVGMSQQDIETFQGDESLLIAIETIEKSLNAVLQAQPAGSEPEATFDQETETAPPPPEVAALSNEVKHLRQQIAALTTDESGKRFDQQIEGLGDGFEHVLGGDEPSRVQAANRKAVKDSMDTIMSGFAASGRPVSEEQAFNMAVAGQFSGVQQTIARQELDSKVASRRKQMTHPPTPRKTTRAMSGDAALQAKLAEMMSDQGMVPEESMAPPEDPGFLG